VKGKIVNNPEDQFRIIQSMTELSADLLVLRDALNELSLILGDLHFQIDDKARATAENETGQMLKRVGSAGDLKRF
jgi:hypothetical protein